MEFGSCVSKYSHIKANKDVNGMEATIPAMSVDLLAISEIITITKAVKIILISPKNARGSNAQNKNHLSNCTFMSLLKAP